MKEPINLMDRGWEVYFSKLRAEPSQLPSILKTWGPNAPGAIELLKRLTDQLPVTWCCEVLAPSDWASSLHQLMRVDDGRGIILPWLVSIIQTIRPIDHLNTDVFREVLGKVSEWRPHDGNFPLLWLEAWAGNLTPQCPASMRQLNWMTIEKSWKEVSQVPGVEAKPWRKRIMELITEYRPIESSPDVLENIHSLSVTLRLPQKAHLSAISGDSENAETSQEPVKKSGDRKEVSMFKNPPELYRIISGMGDEAGECIVKSLPDMKYLTTESALSKLYVMSSWKPSGHIPLPPGFWREWKKVLFNSRWTVKPWNEETREGRYHRDILKSIVYRIKDSLEDWVPWNIQEFTEALDFWTAVAELPKTVLPGTELQRLGQEEQEILELIMPEKIPLDVFHKKIHGLEELQYIALLKKMEAWIGKPMEGNIRYHQLMTAAWGLHNFPNSREISNISHRILSRLWDHPQDMNDKLPPGWEYLYQILMTDQFSERHYEETFCAAMRLGHALHLSAHHKTFMQMLEKAWYCPGHYWSHLMETALWREAIVLLEVNSIRPDATERLDEHPQFDGRRTLRLIMHFLFSENSRPDSAVDNKKAGKGKETGSFQERLWKTLLPELVPQQLWRPLPHPVPDVSAETGVNYSFQYRQKDGSPGQKQSPEENPTLRTRHPARLSGQFSEAGQL